MQICKENQAVNAEARKRAKNQYRPSSGMQGVFGEKKIEEEYSLYNHPIDDDADDGFLGSIIEEVEAEDEEDKEMREKIKLIENNIHEKKSKLEQTQKYISEITTKINQNQIKEVNTEIKDSTSEKEEENDAIKEEEKDEVNSDDDEDLAQYLENLENDDTDGEEEKTDEVYKKFEENITLVKLRDKIKLLRYRWEASLGYTLFEKAYKLIKNNAASPNGEKIRTMLIDLIGEENIGFWVIFDNILFLEQRKKDLGQNS